MDKKSANFLFETIMLQKTPRSGFKFLGSGKESVAEHSLLVIFVAYVLGKMAENIDEERLLKMSLFHDILEARTGDMNYVNKKYVDVDQKKAAQDMATGLLFESEALSLLDEFESKASKESLLVHDADQIALLLKLKECKDVGNNYAEEWIKFALRRLSTEEGDRLAQTVLSVDFADWWFSDKSDWWVNGKNE